MKIHEMQLFQLHMIGDGYRFGSFYSKRSFFTSKIERLFFQTVRFVIFQTKKLLKKNLKRLFKTEKEQKNFLF